MSSREAGLGGRDAGKDPPVPHPLDVHPSSKLCWPAPDGWDTSPAQPEGARSVGSGNPGSGWRAPGWGGAENGRDRAEFRQGVPEQRRAELGVQTQLY